MGGELVEAAPGQQQHGAFHVVEPAVGIPAHLAREPSRIAHVTEARVVGGEGEPHSILYAQLRLEAFVQPGEITHAGLDARVDGVQILDAEQLARGG